MSIRREPIGQPGKSRSRAGKTGDSLNILAQVHSAYFAMKGLPMNEESTTLSGWWVFAGVLLLVAGVLNIIYGIAAIGDSKFFTENATYIISGLHTWGWVMLIIGVLELV